MERPRDLTHRATHAAWWSAVEIGTRYAVQFAVTVVLARILSPTDFGLVAMLLVFTTFAAIFVEGGLGSALVQKQATDADQETSVFLVNLGTGCALAVLLWWLAPRISAFYAQPHLVPLLHLMLWLLPLGALATVPNALLGRRLDFRKRAAVELVASAGSATTALWLAWRGFGAWSLAWQAIVAAILRATLLWWLSGWRPRGRFNVPAFAGLFRFGAFLLLANALNVASVRLQSLLIGRLFDARTLGFYSMAQDTQQAPAQFMITLLNRVGMPMFSSVSQQPAKLAGALRLALRLSMFLFAPCMLGIAVVAEPLVALLYGPRWLPVAPILSVLALATLFSPLHVLNLAALGALGRSDVVFKLEIAKALITIPMVVAASMLGVLAVAWAVAASSLASVLVNTWYSHRLLGCGLRVQLRELLPAFLLAATAAAAAWLASRWASPDWPGLVVAVAAAAATYAAGAAAARVQAGRDLLAFVRTLRTPPVEGEPG